MAHLWIHDAEGWLARRLGADCLDLGAIADVDRKNAGLIGAREAGQALLRQTTLAGTPAWTLMAAVGAGVRVNGEPPPAGLRVLADRDEIRTSNRARFYFSTEALPQVEPFPGAERPVYCGRCRQAIETGTPAVRCPACGVWYNQAADLPCWTYAETCAFCGQTTALDAGFQWTPEEVQS